MASAEDATALEAASASRRQRGQRGARGLWRCVLLWERAKPRGRRRFGARRAGPREGGIRRGIWRFCKPDCLAKARESPGQNGEGDREVGFYRGCWTVLLLLFSIFTDREGYRRAVEVALICGGNK
jgi:hypothetical protein